MPPKALFDRSQRPDDLVMPSCKECNSQTSTADAVASILSRWKTSDMTEAEKENHKRLAEGLKRSHPDIVNEWTGMSLLDRLKAKRDYIKDGIDVPGDAGLLRIGPKIADCRAFASAGIPTLLHHSRYADDDRQYLDRQVLAALGPGAQRAGMVVVSTQTCDRASTSTPTFS